MTLPRLCVALIGLALAQSALAGLYWDAGVETKVVSVCFVGDAASSRPDRVQQVMNYIKEYQYAANVIFDAKASCSAPTTNSDGTSNYDGDIRVLLPFTSAPWMGAIPGVGCTSFLDSSGKYTGGNDNWTSWSGPPNDVAGNHQCLYNLKLGDDGVGGVPYLNHTLHEFGHALGLAHEFLRADVDLTLGCTESNYGGGSTSYLTRFDRLSVMNYVFASCGINGNYANTGLSDMDRMAVHILYPEDMKVAEFVGTTVVPSSDHLVLQSAWIARQTDPNFPVNHFEWSVAGTVRGNGPVLDVQLAEGTQTLQFSYQDFLGRTYNYTGIVRVMNPAAFTTQTAAVGAALLPLL
jgi:hypothetical protein